MTRPIRKRQPSAAALMMGSREKSHGHLHQLSTNHAVGVNPNDTEPVPDFFASNPDIMSRAAAAVFDNTISRAGKWSVEEETFANRLIVDFECGLLTDCEDGCTLRSYLARKLNCAPMRISKKFAKLCIGKHVFNRKNVAAVRQDPEAAGVKRTAHDMPVIKVAHKSRRINNGNAVAIAKTYTDENKADSLSSSSGNASDGGGTISPSPSFDSFHNACTPHNNIDPEDHWQNEGSKLHPTQSASEFSHFLLHNANSNMRSLHQGNGAVGLDIDDLEPHLDGALPYDDYVSAPLTSSSSSSNSSTYDCGSQAEAQEWHDVLAFFCGSDQQPTAETAEDIVAGAAAHSQSKRLVATSTLNL